MHRRETTPGLGNRAKRKAWVKVVLVNLLIIVFLIAVTDTLFVVLLDNPPRTGLLHRIAVSYYMNSDRNIVQFSRDCARYDEELGYTLRPGSCRFANREFDTGITVNSKGLRDDEFSLLAPAVVALGDSHTMGWGVEQQETFVERVARACNVSALNAGISSYGTAREVTLLRRLDLSALEWLFIQYSATDLWENFTFQRDGDRLVPMERKAYEDLQDQQAAARTYFPGKHFLRFTRYVVRRFLAPTPLANDARPTGEVTDEVELFLHALQRAPALPTNVHIVVFPVAEGARWNAGFIDALRRRLQSGDVPEPWRGMVVLDPSREIGPDQFFVLDEHMTVEGHRRVAALITAAMGCGPAASPTAPAPAAR